MEFLIADTHFHHKKIIEFEVGRSNEFNDVEQMDNEMISNWNNTVGEQDTIYFLGDLSIKSDYKVLRLLLSKLNGHIIYILGNHDSAKTARRLKEGGLIFDYHEVGLRLKIQKHILYLTHYPMMIGIVTASGIFMDTYTQRHHMNHNTSMLVLIANIC